jgi:hypothetical protein
MSTPAGTGDSEPRVRDAVIGAAFGVLLIYLGTLIPMRLARWPVLGCGILFVIVMVGFVLVTFWKHVSPHVRRQLDKALGHVRNDPQLGTLTRHVKGEYWQASLTSRDRSVDVIIDGEDEPNPALLARAREIVTKFDVLEARLDEYLASEAKAAAVEDPEFAAEIGALRVSTILLRSNDGPNRVMIDFEGPDEMRYWYCDYVDGELSGLTFD